MDERTAKLRERNRRRRGKKSGINLKFAVDFLYAAAVVLVIVGWAVKLPALYVAAGALILAGALYSVYAGLKALKDNPKKSPEYKAAFSSVIFFSVMAVVSILIIIFGAIEL